MLYEQTKTHIDSLSDEMLYQYATDSAAGYSEEAMAYAKEVVAKRQFDPHQIAVLEEASAEQQRIRTEELRIETEKRTLLAEVPLSGGMRALFFVLGFVAFIPAMICCIVCRAQGKKRKARQMLVASLVGFAAALALFLATPLLVRLSR